MCIIPCIRCVCVCVCVCVCACSCQLLYQGIEVSLINGGCTEILCAKKVVCLDEEFLCEEWKWFILVLCVCLGLCEGLCI